MGILFAGNCTEAANPLSSDFYMSGGFRCANSQYAPDGDMRSSANGAAICPFITPVPLGGTCWVHFKVNFERNSDIYTSPYTSEMCWLQELGNINTKSVGICSQQSVGSKILVGTNTSGSFSRVGPAFPMNAAQTYTVDMHCCLDPVLGFVLVYLGGILAASYYGDTTISGQVTQWDQLQIKALGIGPVSTFKSEADFSEILISTTKTIGQRVVTVKPTSNGSITQWDGDYTSVDDLNPDDGTTVGTSVLDAEHLFGMSNMNAAFPSDLNIAGFVTSYRATNNGAGVVTGMQHAVKNGANPLQTSPTKSLSASIGSNQYAWETNPDTTLPWTVAEINAVEMGMKAKG